MRFALIFLILLLSPPSLGEVNSQKELFLKYFRRKVVKVTKIKDRIIPKRIPYSRREIEKIEKDAVKNFNPEKLLRSFPKDNKKGYIKVVDYRLVSFLPFREYLIKWKRKGEKVKVIIINDGVFSLKRVWNFLKDKKLMEKRGNAYYLKSPLFIGKNAALVVKNCKLRLAVDPGAPIFINGKLFISNSEIRTWNTKTDKPSPLPELKLKQYYYYGAINPRPFILTLKGGKLVALNSTFRDLGYRGLLASFGVSITNWPTYEDFNFSPPQLFLENDEVPKAIVIGCNFIGNYMGFYSNRAGKLILTGNYFKNNFQYNIDPHDWSKNVLIAFNVIEGAKKAHGVVFSRYVEGLVLNNVVFNNHGAGIMMDRNSKSVIYGNVLVGNRLGGITISESDNNVIVGNTIVRNGTHGIYVRNSLNALVKDNEIIRNKGHGEEVAIMDISYQIYRDLYIDPYRLAASSWIENNSFWENLQSNVKVTQRAGVAFFKNRFHRYALNFSGDISPFSVKILTEQNNSTVIIPGWGDLGWIRKKKYNLKPYLENIECSFLSNNPSALTACAILKMYPDFNKKTGNGIRCLIKAGSEGETHSLAILGMLALSSKNKNIQYEGTVLLSEASLLGDKIASYLVSIVPFFSKMSESDIEKATELAIGRIKEGKLLNCSFWHVPERICSVALNGKSLQEKMSYTLKLKASKGFKSSYRFFLWLSSDYVESNLESQIENLKRFISEKNKRFEKFFEWEEKAIKYSENLYKRNERRIKRYILKSKALKEQWKFKLKETESEDFSLISERVKNIIKTANKLRAPGNKIDISSVLKDLERQFNEVH